MIPDIMTLDGVRKNMKEKESVADNELQLRCAMRQTHWKLRLTSPDI